MPRIAILDFGTNTFNLLIAETGKGSFQILNSSKQPAKLGRGGIHLGRITPDAFERGMVAISNHMETIRAYQVDTIRAFATSAIRHAANGEEFTTEVKKRFGFRVRVIAGEREAELIYKGVRQATPLSGEKAMILDIGGGSNEFIICSEEGIAWKQSFELGMARILERFRLSDPIRPEEVRVLESYFRSELSPLLEAVERENPRTLIGASGSFDTFYELIRQRDGMTSDQSHGRELPMRHYQQLHTDLLHSTLEERRHMPGMDPVRVEMIVPASIFVSFVIRSCQTEKLLHSEFALKEGVIAELVGL